MNQHAHDDDAPRPPALKDALVRAVEAGGVAALPAEVPAALWRQALLGPAAEFLGRPGKEFRARLVELTFRGVGGAPGAMPEDLPNIVELLHAGSLIVDDVEDDSPARRGGPALHTLVGAPLAINCGSWMYFWALALIPRLPLDEAARASLMAAAVQTLVRCHQGQALDLAARVGSVEPAHLPAVVAATTRGKTGALMGLAARLGATAGGADVARVEQLARVGEELGVALQLLDDVGGLGGPSAGARHAKGLEDVRDERPTWAWALLAETQDQLTVARLQHRVRAHRGDPDEIAAILASLGAAVREVGRARVAAQLAELRRALATLLSPEVAREAEHELARLEVSYG
ncbi:MAG: polyprenyl synthetase family protein [Kofleriaceae bacterium]